MRGVNNKYNKNPKLNLNSFTVEADENPRLNRSFKYYEDDITKSRVKKLCHGIKIISKTTVYDKNEYKEVLLGIYQKEFGLTNGNLNVLRYFWNEENHLHGKYGNYYVKFKNYEEIMDETGVNCYLSMRKHLITLLNYRFIFKLKNYRNSYVINLDFIKSVTVSKTFKYLREGEKDESFDEDDDN